MSFEPAELALCTDEEGPLLRRIEPRSKDLGGFSVKRVLPAPTQRMIGPFVFVDEMGPADFPPGQGIKVRPHPHIGLATVTFLFEGQILHRDSLGYVQAIEPGAVNLMTAGRGIVHSERTAEELLASGQRLHGMQVWMALPEEEQECEPAFDHYGADRLPVRQTEQSRITLILGEAFGLRSPVAVRGTPLYAEIRLNDGASLLVPDEAAERGLYVVAGSLNFGDCIVSAGTMAVLRPGPVSVTAQGEVMVMLFGGAPMSRRKVWWNFVHSDPERIEQAKADWEAGRFPKVLGDDEYIPLPEE